MCWAYTRFNSLKLGMSQWGFETDPTLTKRMPVFCSKRLNHIINTGQKFASPQHCCAFNQTAHKLNTKVS